MNPLDKYTTLEQSAARFPVWRRYKGRSWVLLPAENCECLVLDLNECIREDNAGIRDGYWRQQILFNAADPQFHRSYVMSYVEGTRFQLDMVRSFNFYDRRTGKRSEVTVPDVRRFSRVYSSIILTATSLLVN